MEPEFIYVWYNPCCKFIPLLLVDNIHNENNVNICKELNACGVVQKVQITQNSAGNARIEISKGVDLVFDFEPPLNMNLSIFSVNLHPLMFSKTTPLDLNACAYNPSVQICVNKLPASWYEARLNYDIKLVTNWPEAAFFKDEDGRVTIALKTIKPFVCPAFIIDKGMFIPKWGDCDPQPVLYTREQSVVTPTTLCDDKSGATPSSGARRQIKHVKISFSKPQPRVEGVVGDDADCAPRSSLPRLDI